MTATEYKTLRESLGTQAEIAEQLGIMKNSLSRRELGQVRITEEMVMALRWLGGWAWISRRQSKRKKAS